MIILQLQPIKGSQLYNNSINIQPIMKKITATENKKYTDKAYSFFTDIIYTPDSAVTDEYFEIDENDVGNIQDSKANIQIESLSDLEQITSNIQEIDKAKEAIKYSINSLDLSNNDTIKFKDYLPDWNDYINKSLPINFKFKYNNQPYKTLQYINIVLENQTPDIVYSLYAIINEEHEGTLEDPIPYVQQMAIEKGKYYSQYGVVYIAIQNMPTGMPYDLSQIPSIVQPV